MKHLERLNEPMLITAEAWRACFALVEESRHVALTDGYKVEVPGMEVRGGVAVIPVHGRLMVKPNVYEVFLFGAVDIAQIADEVRRADADPDVSAIVLDIESPGGTVNGTPELAAAVASCSKPTFAYTSMVACSGGYWVASAADNLLCAPSATVGHVGAMSIHKEYSRALEDEGVTVNVLQSDPLKTAGNPWAAMTDEQRATLQARVDFAAQEFKEFVRKHRPAITAEDMQAQCYWGKEAVANGYADALAGSLAEVVHLAGGSAD